MRYSLNERFHEMEKAVKSDDIEKCKQELHEAREFMGKECCRDMLVNAIILDKFKIFKFLIEKESYDINTKDNELLQLCAQYNRIYMLKWLIEKLEKDGPK